MPGRPALPRLTRVLAVIGPGVLVAATGVGAGDLATAALAGGRLGTAILWAVVVGAFLKFVLTEGLARWQLASGQTLLEGAIARLGHGLAIMPASGSDIASVLGIRHYPVLVSRQGIEQ